MKRWALCLVAIFGCALLTQSQVLAASSGVQSGTSGRSTGGAARGMRGAAPGALPRGGFVRPGFPGAGLPGRGLPGRFPGGIGRFGNGVGRFGAFGQNRLRGGLYAGVTGFVPLPGLLGLPYYDGLEYPYFFPDTAAPYIDDIYGFPPAYLPPAASYSLPPQTDYLPPPSQDGSAGAAGAQVWYYCQDPMGYYPYIRDCNAGWQVVPASVLPPPSPQ